MADRRDRIIVATNELFRRHGYNGTSLSQISDASDSTIGSIYHFFPGGKEALAVAVIETTGTIYRELFESIAGQASDPAQAYVDFFAGAAMVLEESDYIDPLFRSVRWPVKWPIPARYFERRRPGPLTPGSPRRPNT